MNRRELITLIGLSAFASQSRAQSSAPAVGFLRAASLAPFTHLIRAFQEGLTEQGFIRGSNLSIEFRSAEGELDRLAGLVAELVRLPAQVIVCDNNAAIAAKSVTETVPIVFAAGGDPVQQGLVASLSQPGGNVTGVTFLTGLLGAKRLELLRQLVPSTATIAMLVHPSTPTTEAERSDVLEAAKSLPQRMVIFDVFTEGDFDPLFEKIVAQRAGALLVGAGPFMNAHRQKIVGSAARHSIPAIYIQREFVLDGGLMSYGTSVTAAYRQAGVYTGRILKGEKPSDLPVVQSAKFEFVINLKSARTLNIEIPDRVLALADEVIE